MKSSQNYKIPKLASQYECLGCLACVDECKHNAIIPYLAEDGHYYVRVDESRCVHCLKCEKLCQKCRNNYGENALDKSKIYAAWSQNTEYRKAGTSGGIFAALAHNIIEKGGCVVGAYFDGKNCKHKVIYNYNEIKQLQGSKYVYSSMSKIYSLLEYELNEHDVLFTGVGCQCAAVLAYFSNKVYPYNLFTVDLVCGGAPSQLLIRKFFEHNPEISQITSFRTKDIYELKIVDKGIESTYETKSLPLHGFNCGMTNRYNCYNCQFATAHRKTDMTIGDLWDYDLFPNEHKKGISMVIVHSEKGCDLLNNSFLEYHEIPWQGPLLKNKRIIYGKQRIFKPRVKLAEACKTMPYDEFVKLYCITMKPKDISLMIFRIYRYVLMQYDSWKAKKYILSLFKK